MNRKQKKTLVAQAKKLVAKRFPMIPVEASCLYSAWAVCQLAPKFGARIILQAGTAYWPRVSIAQDDGVIDTHFGYEWGSELTQYVQSTNGIVARREMHAWAACPATREVIDITAGHWPQQCRNLLGLDWPGPKPPAYLWCHGEQLPERVFYRADREACELAVELLAGENLRLT